jgi:hypothetical protein
MKTTSKYTEYKERISRLIKILGEPYDEIVGIFYINDDLWVDSISVVGVLDFEMSIFSKVNEEDYETILSSDYLTLEELENLVNVLEDYLIKN